MTTQACVLSLNFTGVDPPTGAFPFVPPESTTDVTAVCGHAENTSERREKEVQVSPGPPECGLRSFISTLRLDPLRKTQPGCTERCLESRNARKRPACVCPCSRPRFDCYFCDIRASASNSCQIGSDPAPTGDRAIGYFGHKIRGRTRDYRGRNTHHCHDHGLCPDRRDCGLGPDPDRGLDPDRDPDRDGAYHHGRGGDDHDRGGGHRRPDLVWPGHHGPEGRPQLLGEHLERFGSAEFVPKPAN